CLEDVVGRPFWEARWWALSEATRERVRNMVCQARQGEFVRCDIEIYGEAQGHKTIVVDFSLTPIRDDAGQVAFLLPEGRNISEKIAIEAELTRKNSELQATLEKLREIDGFKTRFFANVSHELRTPLALILGPANQLLKDSGQLDARSRFRLETIKRNAQSLLRQVNDLLDLARIDAEKMPMAYVSTDVVAVVREVAAGFATAAEERGIALTVEGAVSLHADIDRAKFVRILANLLSNAFKFTPDGGRIRCLLQPLGEPRFLLSVQDNGPGVPQQIKAHIFERFAQGGDGLSAVGSGLGLNIVREFVELHHGTVAVLDAPGHGAMFQVELPRHAPDGAFVRPADAGEVAPPIDVGDLLRAPSLPALPQRNGLPRILVVEDNPDLRQFLHDVLADDYQVTLAENGAIALGAVGAGEHDLVITDLMMPELDGEHFIRELRTLPGVAKLPVLVLSARSDDALRESLLDELAQDYLIKPFSPQELRARVRNLVTVKRTVDILQKELNSQASDISMLTEGLVASRKSLQEGLLALQISERRWLGFYENTAVGLALADTEGHVLRANPALQRMLGLSAEEIVGQPVLDIGRGAGSFVSCQKHRRYERKDGGHLLANVCASLVPAVDREGPRIAVVVQDVTSQKEAEDALAVTQADLARVSRLTMMGELVASIAHEVNQPLTAIVANTRAALRWLGRDEPDYQEVEAALLRANRDAMHAGDVIARTRSFLQKGGLTRKPVDIGAILDALLQMLQRALAAAGVTVRTELSPGLPALIADPVQLQQVLLNLVVNATDAMRNQPGRREITIVVREDAGSVCFSVADTGPGIAPETASQIFDTFFSTKADGLGMGLAISRTIVERHGGRLWLDANGADGCRFAFRIPLLA
ncbi:MAG: response regulator, partial [Zoogloea sp.]|nr:response regulator [Zoogloea sp.]